MASTVGALNPFRYRGYYYDIETGLYYLQNRYYDPSLGRFINADGAVATGTGLLGYNMFAYCNNDPVNASDPSGYFIKYTDESGSYAFITSSGNIIIHEPGQTTVIEKGSQSKSILFSKVRDTRPDSGLSGLPDDEISRRAHDNSLSGKERRRYQTEEKYRGLRNKQKRENRNKQIVQIPNISLPSWVTPPVSGAFMMIGGTVVVIALVADDTTGVGISDDELIPWDITLISEGAKMCFG